MKNLTKFKKRIIAIVCLAVVAAICATVYFVGGGKDDGEKDTQGFTEQEIAAIEGFKGKAVFTFKADKGQADAFVAVYMGLADRYSKVNGKIKVQRGTGDKDCVLTVNGKEYMPDPKELFKTLEDGTPYASSARMFFNKALFGSELGATADALDGYDLDGDRVNHAGFAYLYGPIDRKDIKGIYITNEYDTLAVIPYGNSFYIEGSAMDIATATVSTLVAAARQPVAEGKVEKPESLAVYGLDSDENATATVFLLDNDGNSYYMRIGKRLTDGSGYYACSFEKGKDEEEIKGKNRVYILPSSISNYILVPKEKFLVANYGTKLEELTQVFGVINDITINMGEDIIKAEFMSDEEKKNHPINYTWKVSSPDRFVQEAYGYALPDYGTMGDVFNMLCSLSTEEVVEADVTEEALKKYGLATPHRSYSWVYSGETRCTVYFSEETEDGNYYVYSVKEDIKSGEKDTIGIGLVSKTNAPFVGYEVIDYMDTLLYTQYFDKLDGIEFTRNGSDYKITLAKNDEGTVQSARLNGKEIDLDSCKNFFRGLLHCKVLGEYVTEDELPEETFRIKVTSNGKPTEISFGRISNMKVYCYVDGSALYEMDYSLYEILVGGADKLVAGETVEW